MPERESAPRRPEGSWSRLEQLFVTDLDGTLLDDSYGFEPARPALAALAAAGAGLALASSKSAAEMQALAERIGSRPVLIVENGGGVLVPRESGGYEAFARGTSHRVLRTALDEIARETGVALRGFTALDAGAVAALTGLDSAAASRALAREYDEPFLLDEPDRAEAVAAAAARRGLRVTRGGRFLHLTGATDKGEALRELFHRLGRPAESIGLGDAPNDLPLLCAVDRPIVVPARDGRVEAELAAALPAAEVAPAPGPSGWNAAVLAVLAGKRLRLVSSGTAS